MNRTEALQWAIEVMKAQLEQMDANHVERKNNEEAIEALELELVE